MSIVLYHHPFSRAANTIWMLEEVGVPYELHFVDTIKGGHKAPEILALNPMGKIPIITDGDVVVTEACAIGLYLADKYAYGTLAPKVDDPKRGPYLRWSAFAPSVIEPGAMAKSSGAKFKETAAGWGSYDAMIKAMNSAIEGKEWILGDQFSMADVIFGGTIRYMLTFKLLDPTPVLASYAERLSKRPAVARTNAKNAEVMKAHGIEVPG